MNPFQGDVLVGCNSVGWTDHVLVFLTGQDEIETLEQLLRDHIAT